MFSRLSATVSSSAPCTSMTTESPCLMPRPMTDRMELAGTGLPPSLAMVTVQPEAVTAWVNCAAGRAWMPTVYRKKNAAV